MKNKILLLAAGVMFLGWSCDNDKDDDKIPATVEVSTPDGVQNALNNGSTTITLKNPLTANASFSVPNSFPADTEVKLVVPANGYNVTVQQDNTKSQSFPDLNLNITSGQTVNIVTPNCSVIYSGTATTLNATTSNTTFTLAKGSTLSTLNVLQGSARIYGLAAAVNNTGSGKTYLALGAHSDRPSTDNVIKQTMALSYVDGIILTEDSYPLFADIKATGSQFGQNNATYSWYLPIEKNGFEIIGDGKAENIILYGKQELAVSDNWSTQNLITVFASNVKIEGITLMNKVAGSKMIEVVNTNFTARNCRFVPNTKVNSSNDKFVGGVYFSRSANNGLIETSLFNEGTVAVDGLTSGTFTVKGCTFDYVRNNDYYAVYTPNTAGTNVASSTMTINLTENEFKNIPVYDAAKMDYPAIGVSYGKVVAKDNKFPTEGIYYHVTGTGELVLNGVTIVPTV